MKSPRNYAKHSYQTEVFEKWKSLSNDMNWSYTKGPWYNSDIIKIKHNSWTIILDNYRDSFTGFGIIYNKFTRVRAPIINNPKISS